MRKYFFAILILFFNYFYLFAEGFWAVNYSISNFTPEEFEEKLLTFYDEKPECIVWKSKKMNESLIYKKDIYYSYSGASGYDLVVKYYLSDLNKIVTFGFAITYDFLKISLWSYTNDFKIDENNKLTTLSNAVFKSINEFNCSEEENQIIKSFEENILNKLDTKWKRNSPTILDKTWNFLSKPLYPNFYK